MLPEPIFLNVHMYGVMVAIGILCAFAILLWLCRKKQIDSKFADFLFYNSLISIAVGFCFAALFQAVYDYIKNPASGFCFNGGLTFIGGLIGGVVCFLSIYFIFREKYVTRLYSVISILPCSILIAHAFGRIGCFFAGCCYGKETNFFIGVVFPGLTHPVHPTQLYEAAFLFLLFAVCIYFVTKKDFKYNLSLYLVAYGVFRFLIEFIRDDDRGSFIGTLTPSQFWSVIMVFSGICVFFVAKKINRRMEQNEEIY